MIKYIKVASIIDYAKNQLNHAIFQAEQIPKHKKYIDNIKTLCIDQIPQK